MDETRFSDGKSGRLVRIAASYGSDWAFIPDPLPPKWDFPSELWPLLNAAHVLLTRLEERGRHMSNPALLVAPLQKREALRSSSLEGTHATAKELLLFELSPRDPVSKADPANEWREVHNYDLALRHGYEKLHDQSPAGLPLSLRLIKDMHRILLTGVRGSQRAGEFRDGQVHVGSDRRYVPPPPERLQECLDSFEKYLNDHGARYHPLVLAYLVHYQFEAIHPFFDGNGRIGRALLSLTVQRWSELTLPWLYMSAYFERYKDEYIDNMFRVSTHGDWTRWIQFCLRGTIEQCQDSIRRCDALNGIRAAMFHEFGSLPRMHSIIENLFFSPVFTVNDVAKWGNSSRPTAKADIDLLISRKYVRHLKGQRPKNFFAPAIFQAAFSEDEQEGAEESDR
ncbi:MAG TPA: Fic family protein [Candidatus Polarisedimenticolaceae bacterium]|nr:Fic family protein [Candidatus Polarisedimenticolaceae bacterium]